VAASGAPSLRAPAVRRTRRRAKVSGNKETETLWLQSKVKPPQRRRKPPASSRRRPRHQRTEIGNQFQPTRKLAAGGLHALVPQLPGRQGQPPSIWEDSACEPLMYKLVVKPRKLIGSVNCHFPPPWRHLAAKPVLQTNGLLEQVSVFGHFWAYKI